MSLHFQAPRRASGRKTPMSNALVRRVRKEPVITRKSPEDIATSIEIQREHWQDEKGWLGKPLRAKPKQKKPQSYNDILASLTKKRKK